MSYLCFRRTLAPAGPALDLPPGLALNLWRPSWRQPLPLGLPWFPYGGWTLFHALGLFASRDYAVLQLWQGQRLVSHLCALPANFKFPFMRPGDLQVALLWTDPALRGGGLGLLLVGELLRRLQAPGRLVWYLAREDNLPSIRLAEKAAFHLWGRGERQPWLGLLGRFQVSGLAPGAGQHGDPGG